MRRIPPLVSIAFLFLCLALRASRADIYLNPWEVTGLALASETGDPLGGGASYHFTPATGTFEVRALDDRTVTARYADSEHAIELTFTAPIYTPLAAQEFYYLDLPDWPGFIRPVAQMAVNIDGRQAASLTGTFNISRYIDTGGGSVAALQLSFEVHADGATPALFGALNFHIDSLATPVNRAPGCWVVPRKTVTFPAMLTLESLTGDDDPYHSLQRDWEKISGPGAVTFGKYHANGWTSVEFAEPGEYRLSLTVSDGEFSNTSETAVTVLPPGELSLSVTATTRHSFGEPHPPVESRYDTNSAVFAVTGDGHSVSVDVYEKNWVQLWRFRFAAPPGEKLARGRYDHAVDTASHGTNYPRPQLEISEGSSYNDIGPATFEVLELEQDADGNVLALHVVFDTSIYNPDHSYRGELRLKPGLRLPGPNRPPGVWAGFEQIVRPGEAVALKGIVADDGPVTTEWTVLSGPAPVKFDQAGARETRASFPRQGDYVLQLAVSDGEFTSTNTCRVQVQGETGPTFLRIVGDPGGALGFGSTPDPAYPWWQFGVMAATDEGVYITVNDYNLIFTVPPGEKLAVGEYRLATTPEYIEPGIAGLRIGGFWWGPTYPDSSFIIHALEFDGAGVLKKFHATFQQYDASGGLHGELRYHADVPLVEAPTPVIEAGGDIEATVGVPVPLAGAITIAGEPAGTRAIASWAVLTGPAEPTVADRHSAATTATFPAAGLYILRLNGATGSDLVSDLVRVFVAPPGAGESATKAGALRGPDGAPAGLVELQLNSGGSFTGSLNFLGFRYALLGEVAVDGSWSVDLPAAGRAPALHVSLRRDASGASTFLVQYEGETFDAALARLTQLADGTFPQELVGPYNFAFTPRGPVAGQRLGSGWGQLEVKADGKVRLVARCPDRTPVVVRTLASADGAVVVLGSGHGGRCILSGVLKMPINPQAAAVDGELQWFHWRTPTRAFPTRHYAATLDVEGSSAPKLDRYTNIIIGPWAGDYASVAIEGLADYPVVAYVKIDRRKGLADRDGETIASFQGDASGRFAGHFRDLRSHQWIPFEGVALPNREIGRGHFFSGGKSGSILVRELR